MKRDLYIYYRVRSEHASRMQKQVSGMQQALAAEYAIVVGLKRRPLEKDGRQTWMEIYAGVPEGFELILEAAVAQAGLTTCIDGPRHTEIFMDVSSCA